MKNMSLFARAEVIGVVLTGNISSFITHSGWGSRGIVTGTISENENMNVRFFFTLLRAHHAGGGGLHPHPRHLRREEVHQRSHRQHTIASKSFIFLFWGGGGLFFFVLYSTLLHLPPLRFHCADGCWDRTQQLVHWQSEDLTTRLDVIRQLG